MWQENEEQKQWKHVKDWKEINFLRFKPFRTFQRKSKIFAQCFFHTLSNAKMLKPVKSYNCICDHKSGNSIHKPIQQSDPTQKTPLLLNLIDIWQICPCCVVFTLAHKPPPIPPFSVTTRHNLLRGLA